MRHELTLEQKRRGGKLSGLTRAAARVRGTSRRRKRLEDAVWDVATNSREEWGHELRRILAAMKKADPVAFVRGVLLQVLPAPPREPPLALRFDKTEAELEQEGAGRYLELVDQMLREVEANVAQSGDDAAPG